MKDTMGVVRGGRIRLHVLSFLPSESTTLVLDEKVLAMVVGS